MANAIQPQKAIRLSEHPNQRVEKFSDPETLLKLHNRALVVCHIILSNNQGGGTGFLIGKDLIMTNNHVLDSLERARGAKALFFHTTSSKAVEVDLAPDIFFYTSPSPDLLGFKCLTKTHLDFTLVSIKSHSKIAEVSHLAFSIFGTPIPEKESHANIIHHPHQRTTYQKISHRENLIKEVSLFTIHYTTTTLPGSSGAPVIDDDGNLIALHRATCTHILKALLEKEMLTALLQELFSNVTFVNQTLILMDAQSREEKKFTGLCATIGDSPLYIFSEDELKGQYFYQEKMASLFRLIATKHTPAKEWALQFLNSRLAEPLADYHCECNTAVSIKAIHDHLKNANVLTQIQAHYDTSQKGLRNLLKESYLQHYALLPLILTNEAFPIESFFTQLSIVSHTSQEKKEEEARKRDPHLIEKDSLRELYARLYETERPIDLETLFEERENRAIKKVLVLGRAGIGKSTLCQKIAHDWASGTLFERKFSFIYHLRLRDLNALIRKYPLKSLHPDKWLSKIIAKALYEGAHQEKIDREMQSHPEKILLIFDGWDEASLEVIQAIEIYFLQTKIKHYLLTSRPGVTQKIHNNFDLVVENMGFNETQIKTYSAKFFTYTNCEGLNTFLKTLYSQSNLFTIAHIPIQLQILCALWQKGEKDFPKTLTPLFSKITRHLFEWEQKKNAQKDDFMSLEQLLLYQTLGEIALKGLENKQLFIPKQLIDKTLVAKSLENTRIEKINRKKLISTGLVKTCGENDEMCFIHLTYQEYIIAKYISSLRWTCRTEAQEKQRIFIQTYRYKPQFHLVIRMLAGCIWEDSNKNIKAMEKFFEWLYGGHKDLIGGYQTELTLSCLEECRSNELEEKIWGKYRIGDFVSYITEHKATQGCLRRLMTLSGRVCAQALKKFQEHNTIIAWFWLDLDHYLNDENIFQILIYVQKMARWLKNYEVLVKLLAPLKEETLLQVVSWLQIGLSNEEENVRAFSAITLGKLVAHVKEDILFQVVKWIQNALNDIPTNTRIVALRILDELVAHVKSESLLQVFLGWIQNALHDENLNVRQGANEILSKLVNRVNEKNIFTILDLIQISLRDEKLTHPTAYWALETLVADLGKETLPQFLDWGQTVHSDKSPKVRRTVISVLQKLSDNIKEETLSQILEWVQTALNDEDWSVHSAAVITLEILLSFVEKEAALQILYRIQEVREKNYGTHECYMSLKTLTNLVTHAKSETLPFILNWFRIALNEDQTKCIVKDQEGCIGNVEEETLAYILNWIFRALNDSTQSRFDSVKALTSLVAHVKEETISQILSMLLERLLDDDLYVREVSGKGICKIVRHLKEETFLQIVNTHIINWIQKDLSHEDIARAINYVVAYIKKDNIFPILNWLPIVLKNKNRELHSSAASLLYRLMDHTTEECIPGVLSLIQIILNSEDYNVRHHAISILQRLVGRVKEKNYPQILQQIQTALSDKSHTYDYDSVQMKFNSKYLMSIFISPPFLYSKTHHMIFDYFINESVPLYILEERGGSTIHTSDSCYQEFTHKQLSLLTQLCASLLYQTPTTAVQSGLNQINPLIPDEKEVLCALI